MATYTDLGRIGVSDEEEEQRRLMAEASRVQREGTIPDALQTPEQAMQENLQRGVVVPEDGAPMSLVDTQTSGPQPVEYAPAPPQQQTAQPQAPDLGQQFIGNQYRSAREIRNREASRRDMGMAQAGMEQEAANAMVQAQIEKQDRVRKLQEEKTAQMAAQNASMQEDKKIWDGARNKVQNEIAALDSELKKSKLDPWEGNSKAGAAIAIMLGGFGAGLTGQPNAALQTVNQMLERTARTQQENYNRLRQARGRKQEESADLERQWESNEAEYAKHAAFVNESFASKIQNVASTIGDAEKKAILMQNAATFQAKADQYKNQFADATLAANQRARANVLNTRIQQEQAQAQASAERAETQLGDFQYMGAGKPSNEARKEMGKTVMNQKILQRKLDAIKAHIKTTGPTVPGSKADAKGKQLLTDLYLQLKNNAELGVLAGPDMDLLEKLGPGNPGRFRSELALDALSNLENSAKDKVRSVAETFGYGLTGRAAKMAELKQKLVAPPTRR